MERGHLYPALLIIHFEMDFLKCIKKVQNIIVGVQDAIVGKRSKGRMA